MKPDFNWFTTLWAGGAGAIIGGLIGGFLAAPQPRGSTSAGLPEYYENVFGGTWTQAQYATGDYWTAVFVSGAIGAVLGFLAWEGIKTFLVSRSATA